MTRKEIIEKARFIQSPNYSQLEIDVFISFFDKSVKVLALNLSNLESDKEMNLVTEIINDLISFKSHNEKWLKRAIWRHYKSCMQNISYNNISIEGYTNMEEANTAYFKIYTEEQAYSRVQLEQIWFDVSFLDFKYYNMGYKCPWEIEHGIKIGVMNGEFDSIE